MIKYITNLIHSLTQSNTAATITSLLTQHLRTGTLQPVPPGPSSIENEASAKNSSKLNKFLHSEVNQVIQHIIKNITFKLLTFWQQFDLVDFARWHPTKSTRSS